MSIKNNVLRIYHIPPMAQQTAPMLENEADLKSLAGNGVPVRFRHRAP